MAVTAYQERRIRELRYRGVGYRTIATELGISRDTVRNYCVSHELSGLATALSDTEKDVCPCCGGKIVHPPARTPPSLLFRHMLPEMVGRPPGGDQAEPGGTTSYNLRVLRERVHRVRKRPTSVLLPQLLYPRPLLAGGGTPGAV